jgi:tetratricopeptide repeat protein
MLRLYRQDRQRSQRAERLFIRNVLLVLVLNCLAARAQTDQALSPKELFEQENWQALAQRLEHAPRATADLNFYYGVATAHLERWHEAHDALETGARLAPRDKRFPLELAGVAFKQRAFSEAKQHLQRALQLDPDDAYAKDFLATVYFLEGNLEAALKYWNRTAKPEIAEVRSEPDLRVRPALLDHAFAFAPQSVLTRDQFLVSEARMRQLDIFSSHRLALNARTDGKFDAVFRAHELNGFGNTAFEVLLRTFGGIIFQEITPEYYNVRRSATNIVTLLRWDPDKRRAYAWLSGPVGGNPDWRYRVGSDLRNENWTVQTSFTGPSLILGALNLRRESFAAEISRLEGGLWSWSTGAELSHRDFRSVFPGLALTPHLLAQGYQLKQTTQLNYELWRWPERRLTASSALNSQAGRIWSQPAQAFEKLQASVDVMWFPRAVGEDYETHSRLSAGKTFGQAPFDELFMLSAERDNNLWLRAHEGTRHGQKGSAPLGGDYVLSNWEVDRRVYSNGFLTLKLGPFLDMGKIWDASPALGSHKWLFDTGAQARLHILGVDVVVLYGKDLRTGNNAFFATVKP